MAPASNTQLASPQLSAAAAQAIALYSLTSKCVKIRGPVSNHCACGPKGRPPFILPQLLQPHVQKPQRGIQTLQHPNVHILQARTQADPAADSVPAGRWTRAITLGSAVR
jgi:hypothetical protein